MIPSDFGPIVTTGTLVEVPSGPKSLPMMLYRPQGASRPGPCILVCPGGTGTGLFEIMEWFCARASVAGYTCLTLSWRATSPINDPDDISAGLDWLKKQGFLAKGQAAVFGASRGANAALRAAATEPRVSAAVTFGAATDFVQLAFGAAAYAPSRFEMLKGWLGDPITQRPFYESVQAISVADRIRCPVLLVHGRHDFHCPIEQSIMMRDKLVANGNSQVQLLALPFVGHYGDVVPNGFAFNYLSEQILEFLVKHLGSGG